MLTEHIYYGALGIRLALSTYILFEPNSSFGYVLLPLLHTNITIINCICSSERQSKLLLQEATVQGISDKEIWSKGMLRRKNCPGNNLCNSQVCSLISSNSRTFKCTSAHNYGFQNQGTTPESACPLRSTHPTFLLGNNMNSNNNYSNSNSSSQHLLNTYCFKHCSKT